MTKWDIFYILSAMQKGKWDFDFLGDLLNKSNAENLQAVTEEQAAEYYGKIRRGEVDSRGRERACC